MKLRPPSTPLITVDPYFSLWMPNDRLNDGNTVHWTGNEQALTGDVIVDGNAYRFMGNSRDKNKATQITGDFSALITEYAFTCGGIKLTLRFFTPVFATDLYRLSRPVSYLNISYENIDGCCHAVSVKIAASEQFCLNEKNEGEVTIRELSVSDTLNALKMGKKEQLPLRPAGDNVRINWGYFYLSASAKATFSTEKNDGMLFAVMQLPLIVQAVETVLFAYDDIVSLEYFTKPIKAYWKQNGITIEKAIAEAYEERQEMLQESVKFGKTLYENAECLGGWQYAELVSLAYRQVIAAHKLCLDENGEILFVSKECFSNGCAATVDVTYPSSPMLLYYNTELLKATMRPVFRFAQSNDWLFDFAPHDVGTYPVLNGQVYGKRGSFENYIDKQMPVEECGNMLIMAANITLLDNSTAFVDKYDVTLTDWVKYLVEYGEDPANQLCTDDFAGHLAHNCNLSLKAIMGIRGFAFIRERQGKKEDARKYIQIAENMAKSWIERAVNSDGSFRLAFDQPDTFSMKYNMIWDKLWQTKLFPIYVVSSELAHNRRHFNIYGMPLDNRKNYTKSDWITWTACLSPTKEDFESYIAPMYHAYDVSLSRVPLTDWYDTFTAQKIGFQHRSVQGGLFIKLLEEKLKGML